MQHSFQSRLLCGFTLHNRMQRRGLHTLQFIDGHGCVWLCRPVPAVFCGAVLSHTVLFMLCRAVLCCPAGTPAHQAYGPANKCLPGSRSHKLCVTRALSSSASCGTLAEPHIQARPSSSCFLYGIHYNKCDVSACGASHTQARTVMVAGHTVLIDFFGIEWDPLSVQGRILHAFAAVTAVISRMLQGLC